MRVVKRLSSTQAMGLSEQLQQGLAGESSVNRPRGLFFFKARGWFCYVLLTIIDGLCVMSFSFLCQGVGVLKKKKKKKKTIFV